MKANRFKGPIAPIEYRGFRTRVRIIGVTRKDSYKGYCEQLSRAHGLKSEYCIC